MLALEIKRCAIYLFVSPPDVREEFMMKSFGSNVVKSDRLEQSLHTFCGKPHQILSSFSEAPRRLIIREKMSNCERLL